MRKRGVPPKIIRRGRNIYTFYKKNKGDKIYWVDHYAINFITNEPDVIDGELLISFNRHNMLDLWRDYPWNFTPEQKALFDKENPYWANFFERRNGTEPPIVDENGVGTIHFND